MNDLLEDHINSVSKRRGSGRKRLDQTEETDGWMHDFCAEYLKTKNKHKAALVTPYKYHSIIAKLNPAKSEYDERFASLVHSCDMQLLEWAKETVYTSLQEAIDQGLDPFTKSRIAMNIARYAANSDWGQQKMDVTHKGTIQFEARRALQLTEIAQSQREWHDKHRVSLLESGERPSVDTMAVAEFDKIFKRDDSEQVIEAEVVDSGS